MYKRLYLLFAAVAAARRRRVLDPQASSLQSQVCGRFGLIRPDKLDLQRFGITELPPLVPRFNIAPSQEVLFIREREGERGAEWAKWGLVPSWAKDPSAGARLANARGDTAFAKPSFKAAMQLRRCLIPADVFYEWQAIAGSKRKQPHAVRLSGGEPFALGGVWEAWKEPAGDWLITCAVLTTDANRLMSAIHDRMPVIIPPRRYRAWLDPFTAMPAVQNLLLPLPSEGMEAWPISTLVNLPANDNDAVLERAEQSAEPQLDVFG